MACSAIDITCWSSRQRAGRDADLANELGDRRSLAAYIVSFVVTGIMWCNARRRDRSGFTAAFRFRPSVGRGRPVQRARSHRTASCRRGGV